MVLLLMLVNLVLGKCCCSLWIRLVLSRLLDVLFVISVICIGWLDVCGVVMMVVFSVFIIVVSLMILVVVLVGRGLFGFVIVVVVFWCV